MLEIMEKPQILDILQDWNFWRNELESGVPRQKYLDRVQNLLETNQIITITGARRAGKSFLMRQTAAELARKGVDKARILMVNLEDPRFGRLDAQLLHRIYETYLEFLAPKEMPFIFLDEVQEVDAWEKWVRSMHELKKAKLIVSGSNAKLLSRELGTLLTGRHLDLTVFPLSFHEFLQFNDLVLNDALDALAKRIEIRALLRAYLEFGSFPEVGLSELKKEILLSYFEDLVHKDLLRRFAIRKPEELKALARFYLSHVSSPITFNSLEKHLGISSSTIEKFSGYLEQVYLVFFLKRFSFKVREQDKSPRKVYAIDTGLSNAIGFRFSENLGKLAENVVFLELKRRQSADSSLELFYWKDMHHHEVDFVLKRRLKVSRLIQVCWNVDDFRTKERELRGLKKAMAALKCGDAVVITEEREGAEEVNGNRVVFVPLWKWLL